MPRIGDKVVRRTPFGHHLLLEVIGFETDHPFPRTITQVVAVREGDNMPWHSTDSAWFEERFGTKQSLVIPYFAHEVDFMED